MAQTWVTLLHQSVVFLLLECAPACCLFALEAREALYGLKHGLPSYCAVFLLLECAPACCLFALKQEQERQCVTCRRGVCCLLTPALEMRLTGGSAGFLSSNVGLH